LKNFFGREEKMELKGNVAIVTGAGQGIGKSIALELAIAGASLVLADIKEDTTEKVRQKIEEMGREVLKVRVDVSKWDDAERMAKEVMERFGRIDILVNDAGISPKGKAGVRLRILDIEDQDWDTVMNVNLKGVFNCSKAVIPYMISNQSGKIVNIGSVAGLTGGAGSPSGAHYNVSKAGVICLTKCLARELGQYHIHVNTIAPGRIMTEMFENTSPEANEEMRRQSPLGKFGRPIDVARAVLYLVSESGDFITGETLVIDGGRTMH
jgi:3-oxoacyl-[acyl-carrier protein] reductase